MRWIKIFLIISVCIILFVMLLPTLLSTPFGKEIVVNRIRKEMNGLLDISSLSLNWLTAQEFEKVKWKDTKKGLSFSSEKIRIDQGLLGFLFSPDIGHSSIEGLKVIIQPQIKTEDQNGNGKLQTKKEKKIPLFVGFIEIHQAQITIIQKDGSPIKIDQLDLFASHPKSSGPISLSVKGKTNDLKKEGSFEIKGDYQEEKSTLPSSSINPLLKVLFPYKNVSFTADVKNFPSSSLDQIISLFFSDMNLNLEKALGFYINADLIREDNEKLTRFILDVDTEYLKGNSIAVVKENQVTLEKPLSIQWKITPLWFNSALTNTTSPFKLKQATLLKITLKDFNKVLEMENFFESSYAITLTPFSFESKETGQELQIDNFSMISKIDPSAQTRDLTIDADLSWDKNPFSLHLKGVTHLKTWSPFCLDECLSGIWDGTINEFPSSFLDILSPQEISYVTLLGKTLNTSLSVKEKGSLNYADISIESERIETAKIPLSIGEKIALLKPITIQYIFPKQTEEILKENIPILLSDRPAEIGIDIFSFNLNSLLSRDYYTFYRSLSFVGKVDSSNLIFFKEGEFIPFEFSSLQFLFNKEENVATTIVNLADINIKNKELELFLGSSGHMRTEARVDWKWGLGWTIDPLVINTTFPNLQIHSNLKIQNEGYFTLNFPSTIHFSLTPTQFNQWFKENSPTLTNTVPIYIVIDETLNPMNFFDINTINLKGSLKSSRIDLLTKGEETATLDNLLAEFNLDLSSESFEITTNANTLISPSNKKGKIDLLFSISSFFSNGSIDIEGACMGGEITLKQFPTPLLEPFPLFQPFTPLLGNLFDLNISVIGQCGSTPIGSLQIDLTSEALDIQTNFKVDEQFLRLNPIQGTYNQIDGHMTPEMFHRLIQAFGINSDLSLVKPIHFNLTFEQLFLPNPWKTPLNHLLTDSLGNGKIELSPIIIKDRLSNHSLTLSNMKGTLSMPKGGEPLALKVDSNTLEFMLSLNKSAIQTPFHWSDLDLKLNAKASRFPFGMLTKIIDPSNALQEQIEVLLGNNVELYIDLDLKQKQGPFNLEIKGLNSELILPGFLSEGTLLLREPLVAQIQMSPLVAKSILGEIIPLLSTATESDQPINITIDPIGFELPLNPLSLEMVEIQNGTLTIGTIGLYADEEILEVLELLKISPLKPLQTIWFTPVYFSSYNGVTKLERFDFLLDNRYPMALWGNINFPNNKVNLKLGLGAKTLEHSFGIKGLPDDFVLPINLKGSLNKASIDKSKATARVASLIGQSRGSPQGLLIGNLLELLTGSFKEEPAPPPTTNPLPWENTKQKKEKKSSPIKSFLKTLKNETQSLIQQIH
ncbi:hypothetical protein N9Y92_01475 [Chlamydiales bacterium]|nr:hypothetical protein [Chlamydiales bacterium]